MLRIPSSHSILIEPTIPRLSESLHVKETQGVYFIRWGPLSRKSANDSRRTRWQQWWRTSGNVLLVAMSDKRIYPTLSSQTLSSWRHAMYMQKAVALSCLSSLSRSLQQCTQSHNMWFRMEVVNDIECFEVVLVLEWIPFLQLWDSSQSVSIKKTWNDMYETGKIGTSNLKKKLFCFTGRGA